MSTYTFLWRVTTLLVFGCLFLNPVAHSQSRLQYGFVDVAYQQAELDEPVPGGGDLDADVISISGSVPINELFFAQAGYASVDFDDVLGISSEQDDFFLGIGWHIPISTNSDFIVDANYFYAEAEACGAGLCISVDDSGYGLNLGVRSLISNDKIELAGIVGYELPDDAAEDSFDARGIMLGMSHVQPERDHVISHSGGGVFAIRQGDWKLILGRGSGGFTQYRPPDDAPVGQLYNLVSDPGEQENLYRDRTDEVERLTALLDEAVERGRTIDLVRSAPR